MSPKSKDDIRHNFDALFKVVSPEPTPPPKAQPPTITVQPVSRDIVPCRSVSFWVDVEGTSPLTFQWRKNGKVFRDEVKESRAPGEIIAASSSYDHTALDLTENGTVFDVIVRNSAGSVTSEPATLLVNAPRVKTEQEQILDIHQIPMSVRKRKKYSDREDMDVHFQPYQFYGKLRRATDSIYDTRGWGESLKTKSSGDPKHGLDNEGNPDEFVRLVSGLNEGTGISVRDIDSDPAQGPREETPLWFLDDRCLDEFLWRMANRKTKPKDRFNKSTDVHPIGRKALVEAAGLDYLILRDFYLLRREDREIFERYEAQFKIEKGHKRHTSSEDAVKQRRLRLVKAGDACYLLPKTKL